MKHLIRKCTKCGRYTLKERCPACNSETIDPHPPRFSPEDKYVSYRIKALYLEKKHREDSGGATNPS
ncbi:MAG: RNA-protein complex protein Nop10 [Desulfurococcales archaeon]|jgi:H/ACA ribonucleoprotein complex subunit 3|nr:RNA-protein complex protein Nop10 [Desulfurococcales archaeon]